MKIKASTRISLLEKIRLLFVSSRPVSWINTAFPFAAGYLASGGVANTYFFIATFYFLIPYNLLLYVVNDVFDYESDMRNPRKNSIEGGVLSPATHRFMLTTAIVVNAIVLMYLFLAGSTTTNLMLVAIVLGAISYCVPPLRFKERAFLDSVNSSFHFVSPLVFALLLTGWEGGYWVYVASFFLWGCASHAFGAVQDILADREAGIKSIGTFLGARKTVRLSLCLYIVATGIIVLAGWPAQVICIPALLYVFMVLPYINLDDAHAERANKGWRKFMLLNQFTGFMITLVLIMTGIVHK